MIKNILKLRLLDWILFSIISLSYISINIKHQFYANNIWNISFEIYNLYPDFFNIISLPVSIFLILKSNFLITKNKNIWQHIIFLFLFINPFVWKNIFVPVNNVLFSISILLSTIIFIYIKANKYKKDMLIPFYFLGLSFALINPYFIIYFCTLAAVDFLIYNKKEDIKEYEKDYFKIFIMAFLISLFGYYFISLESSYVLADRISLFINNSLQIFPSLWGFLFTFSLIGLLISFFYNLKTKTLDITYILFVFVFIVFICFASLYKSAIFPYSIIIVIGTMFLLEKAPLVGKIITVITLIFSISSFYAVSDNYQKDMQFKEMMIKHIVRTYNEYNFNVIVGNIPESNQIKKYNFYPDQFLFKNHEKYQYILRKKGLPVIFFEKSNINERFNIYKSKKIKDFKYFSIYKEGNIQYLYIKNPTIDAK